MPDWEKVGDLARSLAGLSTFVRIITPMNKKFETYLIGKKSVIWRDPWPATANFSAFVRPPPPPPPPAAALPSLAPVFRLNEGIILTD